MLRKTKVSAGEIAFAAIQTANESKIAGAVAALRDSLDLRGTPAAIEPGAFLIDEFCQWARVARTTTFGEIKAGRLKAVKVGRRTLIPMEAAKAWLASLPTRSQAA